MAAMWRALDGYTGRLLVACSGGADSTCLAHATMRRAQREGLAMPLLVYVDHGLRAESAAEGQLVLELARAHGAEGRIVPAVVGGGASLEAEARDARYQALEEVAAEWGARWVLLGHTRSDQSETVLMRILRGTGIPGLAGIPKERDRFARPLLELRRSETEAYCRREGLAYIEDPMNRDPRFTRSRIRHELLPALRRENPRVDDALCALADSARQSREVLDWAARQFLQEVREGSALRAGTPWREVPQGVAARALVLHAESYGRFRLERSHILALLDLARASSKGQVELCLPGLRLRRNYDRIDWQPSKPAATSLQVEEGYRVRPWRAGDRMRPRRLKGRSRKLSDLYADLKLPRDRRELARVVEDAAGEIVWAEHIGPAHGADVKVSLQQSAADDAK